MSETRAIPLVAELDWTHSSPQRWYDSWRATERICRHKGRCIVCYRRCYGFDDGENDPRGILGRHAVAWLHPTEDASLVRSADPADGPPHEPLRPAGVLGEGDTIVICAECINDYDSYTAGMGAARQVWKRLGWRLP